MVRMTKKFFTSRKIVIYFSHRVLLGNKQNFERGGGGSKRGDMLNQLFYHINTSNKFMPHIQYLCETN